MDKAGRVDQARQAWNAGDLDGYLTLYGAGIRLHGFSPEPLGKTAATGFYRMIWAGLTAPGEPSPQLEFHETLVDGDLYCCRFTMAGAHTGDFMGAPASGKPFRLDGITILRFDGDQVAERWSTADFLGMLVQVGVMPPPG